MNGSQRSWMCSHLKVMLSFICSLMHTMLENGLNAKKGLLWARKLQNAEAADFLGVFHKRVPLCPLDSSV